MFTWICPKCGGEVPPSYSECPRCSGQTSQRPEPLEVNPEPIAEEEPAAASPPPPPYVPAPEAPVPVPVAAKAPARRWSPTLVAAGTVLVMGGLLALLYLFVLPRTQQANTDAPVSLESPASPRAKVSANPLAKNLEITGVRIAEAANGRIRVQYLAVNHSGAQLPSLEMYIALEAGNNAVLEFPAKLPALKPFESKDLTASIRSDLKSYELPDWQQLRPRFEITGE